MVKTKAGKFITSPAPRDVPGYANAVANNAVPQVPASPPHLVVVPSAKQRLNVVTMIIIISVISIIAVMLFGQEDGGLPLFSIVVLGCVTLVSVLMIGYSVKKWGQAIVSELQHGYITTTFKLGRFWIGAAPDGPITHGWVEWNWDSTWVLNSKGEVVTAPTGDTDPPGLYPSPRREGELELWTGQQWTGYFPKRR